MTPLFALWFFPSLFCAINTWVFFCILGKDFIRTRGELAAVILLTITPGACLVLSFVFIMNYFEYIGKSKWYEKVSDFFDKEL
jgi:hypothetical protein